eukprot:6517290-Alexandrium_andersonii.AAC.1
MRLPEWYEGWAAQAVEEMYAEALPSGASLTQLLGEFPSCARRYSSAPRVHPSPPFGFDTNHACIIAGGSVGIAQVERDVGVQPGHTWAVHGELIQ